jgi:hypothetical protein
MPPVKITKVIPTAMGRHKRTNRRAVHTLDCADGVEIIQAAGNPAISGRKDSQRSILVGSMTTSRMVTRVAVSA